MKKTLTLFAAVLMTASLTLTVPLSVSAADYANVVLNGKSVSYSDPLARPQIINSRTMVPFRDYAEELGIVIDYQEATKIMSFNQNGMSFSHVAGTMTTTVNGVVKNYDTPSMSINDYTMMPITMLLDAVNAANTWDDTTKTVNITTKTAEPPIVRNVSAASTSVKRDELITLYITTNLSATQVKVQNSAGAIMTQVTESASDSSGRYFTASFFPPAAGSQLFTIYGGDASSFSSSFSAIGVEVEEPVQLEVFDVTPEDSSVDEGDEVVVTIETSTDVVRVEIEDEDGDVVDSATTPAYQGAQLFEWELSFDADNVDGNVDYDVYVFNADGTEGSSYFRINVNGDGSSSSSNPQITDWEYDVDSSDTVTLTVETNRQVDSVVVLDDDEDEDDYLDRDGSSSNSGSSHYEWDLEFDADYEGDYYIYAYNDDEDEYDRERIDIDFDGGSSSGSGSGNISRVDFDNDDEDEISEGDRVDITVRTDKNVGRVAIFEENSDDDDEELDEDTSPTTSGSYYEWDISFYAEDSDGTYQIRAYDEDDDTHYDDYELDIAYVDGEPEIDDVAIDYDGDIAIITVETNTAVVSVDIYDGNRDTSSYRADRDSSPTKHNGYYEWELEVDSDDWDNGTYYIRAYNDDDDEDYDTIEIDF